MCHHFEALTEEELTRALDALEETGRAVVAGDGTLQRPQAPDVWPGSKVAVLVPAAGPRRFEAIELLWGFDPAWGGKTVFNTRIETALTQLGRGSGMWADILSTGRCLVPARGFYEPRRVRSGSVRTSGTAAGELDRGLVGDGGADRGDGDGPGKGRAPQVRFCVPGTGVFLMAGVWRDGRFSVVTTAPNPVVAAYHNRMPLVLGRGESSIWLEGDAPGLERLADRSNLPLTATDV